MLSIEIGIRKEGLGCFDGLSFSVSLNTGKAAFEIGTNFRTRVEFNLQRVIICSVDRMIEHATIM